MGLLAFHPILRSRVCLCHPLTLVRPELVLGGCTTLKHTHLHRRIYRRRNTPCCSQTTIPYEDHKDPTTQQVREARVCISIAYASTLPPGPKVHRAYACAPLMYVHTTVTQHASERPRLRMRTPSQLVSPHLPVSSKVESSAVMRPCVCYHVEHNAVTTGRIRYTSISCQ